MRTFLILVLSLLHIGSSNLLVNSVSDALSTAAKTASENVLSNPMQKNSPHALDNVVLRVPTVMRAVTGTDSIISGFTVHGNSSSSSILYSAFISCEFGLISVSGGTTESDGIGATEGNIDSLRNVMFEVGATNEYSQSITISGLLSDINEVLMSMTYRPPHLYSVDGISLFLSLQKNDENEKNKVDIDDDKNVKQKTIKKTMKIIVTKNTESNIINMKKNKISAISYTSILPFLSENIELYGDNDDENIVLSLQCLYCEWIVDVSKYHISVMNSTEHSSSSQEHSSQLQSIDIDDNSNRDNSRSNGNGDNSPNLRPILYLSGKLKSLKIAIQTVIYTPLISSTVQDVITVCSVDKNELLSVICESKMIIDILGRTRIPFFHTNFMVKSVNINENENYYLSNIIQNERKNMMGMGGDNNAGNVLSIDGEKNILSFDPIVNELSCRVIMTGDNVILHNKNETKNDSKNERTNDSTNESDNGKGNVIIGDSVSEIMQCSTINNYLNSISITFKNNKNIKNNQNNGNNGNNDQIKEIQAFNINKENKKNEDNSNNICCDDNSCGHFEISIELPKSSNSRINSPDMLLFKGKNNGNNKNNDNNKYADLVQDSFDLVQHSFVLYSSIPDDFFVFQGPGNVTVRLHFSFIFLFFFYFIFTCSLRILFLLFFFFFDYHLFFFI